MASMSTSEVSVGPWSNPSNSANEHTSCDADVVEGCTKAYSTRSCASRYRLEPPDSELLLLAHDPATPALSPRHHLPSLEMEMASGITVSRMAILCQSPRL
jgi:hypothetical protein